METEIKHPLELKIFIKDHRCLWWWVPEEKIENLDLNSIVKAILSYGDIEDIKKLFELIGIEKAAEIFNKQIIGLRPDYSNKTINFFKLYFQRHAQRNFN